ncbi:MAG: hypothetical protein HYZ18_04225 [Pseudogulbenkiania sp.]|nr:hypothetical protein [Pseudogulbenkiania sp.]
MKTTASSSAEHVPAIESLPEAARLWLYSRDAELLRRRASDHATGQRVRDSRTQRKRAVVWRAINDHAAALNAWPPHRRAGILHAKMESNLDYPEVPSVDFIRPIVYDALDKGVLAQNRPLKGKR